MQNANEPVTPVRPRYRWPWFILAAFLLALILAALWMSYEVTRTKRIRDLNAPGAQIGNQPAPLTPKP